MPPEAPTRVPGGVLGGGQPYKGPNYGTAPPVSRGTSRIGLGSLNASPILAYGVHGLGVGGP
jgi:hypothetical protein